MNTMSNLSIKTQIGITTEEIDKQVHEYIISHKAYPSPLQYKGFPKSVCTSINNVVCHGIYLLGFKEQIIFINHHFFMNTCILGIPDNRSLLDGDIINIDVTVSLKKNN